MNCNIKPVSFRSAYRKVSSFFIAFLHLLFFYAISFFPIVENSYKTRLILYQQTSSIAVVRVMDSSLKLAFFYFTTSKMKTHHIRLKR